MFQPEIAPLGSLWLSALVGLLPLLTIFVLLGWLLAVIVVGTTGVNTASVVWSGTGMAVTGAAGVR